MSPILVKSLVDIWSGWAVSGTASLKKPWVMDTIWTFLVSWLSVTFKFHLLPPLPTPSIFPQAADTPAHFIWYICMPPCLCYCCFLNPGQFLIIIFGEPQLGTLWEQGGNRDSRIRIRWVLRSNRAGEQALFVFGTAFRTGNCSRIVKHVLGPSGWF